jgi:hypothetical protein
MNAEQPNESEALHETAPPRASAAAAVDPTGLVAPKTPPETQVPASANRDVNMSQLSLKVSLSGSPKPLPTDALSPAAIERLRSGEPLSAEDLEKLRSAAFAGTGILGKVMEGMLAEGLVNIPGPDGADPGAPGDQAGNPNFGIVPGTARTFRWKWKGNDPTRATEPEPATYYEALTGRPDPMREFFIRSRQLLNVVTWFIALGIPVGLVTVGIVTGASSETIFFMGFAGLVVGMLFKQSLPKTPFG